MGQGTDIFLDRTVHRPHQAAQHVDRSVDVAVQEHGVCLSAAHLGAVIRLCSPEDAFCFGVADVVQPMSTCVTAAPGPGFPSSTTNRYKMSASCPGSWCRIILACFGAWIWLRTACAARRSTALSCVSLRSTAAAPSMDQSLRVHVSMHKKRESNSLHRRSMTTAVGESSAATS